MKKDRLFAVLILGITLLTASCASTEYNTQKGAAIGAAVGAIAGQAIGGNTAGTLIGAAGGALAGAVAGNAIDQNETNKRLEKAERQTANAAVPVNINTQEQPPGQWVEVPGQWLDGKWIPAHRAWVPVNPGPSAGK
jgi:outer membrane lipoprotein SlyB